VWCFQKEKGASKESKKDQEELDFMFDEELEELDYSSSGRRNNFTEWSAICILHSVRLLCYLVSPLGGCPEKLSISTLRMKVTHDIPRYSLFADT
jgi:hypothetical protein